jgi:hypothetical protein
VSNDDTTDDAIEADRHEDRRSQPMTDDSHTDRDVVEPSATWQTFDDETEEN